MGAWLVVTVEVTSELTFAVAISHGFPNIAGPGFGAGFTFPEVTCVGFEAGVAQGTAELTCLGSEAGGAQGLAELASTGFKATAMVGIASDVPNSSGKTSQPSSSIFVG